MGLSLTILRMRKNITLTPHCRYDVAARAALTIGRSTPLVLVQAPQLQHQYHNCDYHHVVRATQVEHKQSSSVDARV
jgi:hypothetical protein